MLYNDLGSSGVQVSAVSFGAMRWPSEQACHDIIQHGLDLGLNYVDTSTGYVQGNSQVWTGRAIRGRRDEILVSSKCKFSKAPAADEVRANIDTSLEAMGLDYFDFYQLWGLSKQEVLEEALRPGGFVEGVRAAQKEGLVRVGLGFTFHGPPETFRAAIDSGEFCAATVSYNLLNRKEEEQIAYAGDRGVGIVIMNPLAGGILALAGDPELDFLRGRGLGPCYGALRFLHANPAISTGIVGFRAVEEVDQAVATLDGAAALDEAFRQNLIARMDAVRKMEGNFCTGCGYCKDCPQGFDPARLMGAMRDFVVYHVPAQRLREWIFSQYPHQDIVAELQLCTECGQCQQKCPQHLRIVEQIRRVKAELGVEPA